LSPLTHVWKKDTVFLFEGWETMTFSSSMECSNFHSDSKGTFKGELLRTFSDILEETELLMENTKIFCSQLNINWIFKVSKVWYILGDRWSNSELYHTKSKL